MEVRTDGENLKVFFGFSEIGVGRKKFLKMELKSKLEN